MKRSTVFIALITLLSAPFFFGCNSPARKVELAEEKVANAENDLEKANDAYLKDLAEYREKVNADISANRRSVDDFKLRIENEKAEVKAEYYESIAKLEQKNSDMEKKLDDYKADGKEQWESFKTEFGRDMDNLGKAFKDLTVNNVK